MTSPVALNVLRGPLKPELERLFDKQYGDWDPLHFAGKVRHYAPADAVVLEVGAGKADLYPHGLRGTVRWSVGVDPSSHIRLNKQIDEAVMAWSERPPFRDGTFDVVSSRSVAEHFVFISTDKAVNPAGVTGATKRVGELLVQLHASVGGMRCTCVRFGNVMGSRGSIIPLFKKLIAEGGSITVTHPDVVRFFMTIPEAVQLVLCAGILGEQGEVFVLDMGNPRKILDLAHEMALLSGFEPGKDIEIAITGLRPGEKLVEELVAPTENTRPTRFEKVSMIIPHALEANRVSENVARLIKTAQENDREGVYGVLSGMGLRFRLRDDGGES